MDKYMDDYIVEDVNILMFNETIPLTPDAHYDAVMRLGREITWKIYEEYGYFKMFKKLEETHPKPTKDDVFEFLLYSNSSLIN